MTEKPPYLKVISEDGEEKKEGEGRSPYDFTNGTLTFRGFIDVVRNGVVVGYYVEGPPQLPEPMLAIMSMSKAGIPTVKHKVAYKLVRAWWYKILRIPREKLIKFAFYRCKREILRADKLRDEEEKLNKHLGLKQE